MGLDLTQMESGFKAVVGRLDGFCGLGEQRLRLE